jgi:hypothetical protein
MKKTAPKMLTRENVLVLGRNTWGIAAPILAAI